MTWGEGHCACVAQEMMQSVWRWDESPQNGGVPLKSGASRWQGSSHGAVLVLCPSQSAQKNHFNYQCRASASEVGSWNECATLKQLYEGCGSGEILESPIDHPALLCTLAVVITCAHVQTHKGFEISNNGCRAKQNRSSCPEPAICFASEWFEKLHGHNGWPRSTPGTSSTHTQTVKHIWNTMIS